VERQVSRIWIRFCPPLAARIPATTAPLLARPIATNHAFNDGNKRTSIILMHLLLDQSGYSLEPLDQHEDLQQTLEDFVVEAVVTGKLSVDAITEWLAPRVRAKT
jgi:death-on-curing family protein